MNVHYLRKKKPCAAAQNIIIHINGALRVFFPAAAPTVVKQYFKTDSIFYYIFLFRLFIIFFFLFFFDSGCAENKRKTIFFIIITIGRTTAAATFEPSERTGCPAVWTGHTGKKITSPKRSKGGFGGFERCFIFFNFIILSILSIVFLACFYTLCARTRILFLKYT